MDLNLNFINGLNTKLSRHLVLIVLIIGLGFNSWLFWQASTEWPDLPLAPERISAKQLRVNEAQRNTLLQNLDLYHQTTVPVEKSTTVFGSPTTN
jgi:hypothetical protein